MINPAAADPFFLALSLRAPGSSDILFQLVNDVITGPGYSIDTRGRIVRIR